MSPTLRLRAEAIRIIEMVMARNVDGLFDAGSRLDQACENCHLHYWYPNDQRAQEAAKQDGLVID